MYGTSEKDDFGTLDIYSFTAVFANFSDIHEIYFTARDLPTVHI